MGGDAVFYGAFHVLNGHFQGDGIEGRAVHLQELNGGDQQARLVLIDVHRNAGWTSLGALALILAVVSLVMVRVQGSSSRGSKRVVDLGDSTFDEEE